MKHRKLISVMLTLALAAGMAILPLTAVADPSYMTDTISIADDEQIKEPEEGATETPTEEPVEGATEAPTEEPEGGATEAPTEEPEGGATEAPTEEPEEGATETPTEEPEGIATEAPTEEPEEGATEAPTEAPTATPTSKPTPRPTAKPSGGGGGGGGSSSGSRSSGSTGTEHKSIASGNILTAIPVPTPRPEPTPIPEPTPSPTPTPEPFFSDVAEDAWYYDSVKSVYKMGLMDGTNDTKDEGELRFDPAAKLTRAMFVTILYRYAGKPAADGELEFKDVSSKAWYAKPVSWATSKKIAEGDDDTFSPDAAVTREETVLMLYRYCLYKAIDITEAAKTNMLDYSDYEYISAYAVQAFRWACGAGVIEGRGADDRLDPQATITRAEVAKIYKTFDDFVKGEKKTSATPAPTKEPSATATPTPTKAPSATKEPSATAAPSAAPTKAPSATASPSATPTKAPSATASPSAAPTKAPSATAAPTKAPAATSTPATSGSK